MFEWFRKPSVNDKLVALLRESQAQQAELQKSHLAAVQALVDASVKQSELTASYLKFFTSAEKPIVRVMTDADEAGLEQRRRDALGTPTLPAIPDSFDPAEWFSGLREEAQTI